MTTAAPGRDDRVAALATDEGIFTVVAADHRDSLRLWLDPEAPDAVPDTRLATIKVDLVRELGDLASGVMLDPEYGLTPVQEAGVLPASCGTIASLEAQGYFSDPDAGTSLLPGWGVEPAKDAGATGVKLLVLVDAETGEPTDNQVEVVRDVLDDCVVHEMPLFLEPLAPTARPERRRTVAVRSARVLGALGPDVLKLPFPVDVNVDGDSGSWRDACAELADAAGPVPWTLLSGGGDADSFGAQLEVAGGAGCAGFIAGRALWGDAVRLDTESRIVALRSVGRDRLARLVATALRHCRPVRPPG